jgi:hypothetical protein
MYVCVISFGTNWWALHSRDMADPFCFRRRAAYFNSAALLSGRRVRHCSVFPGQIRFNSQSSFDPEHPLRTAGKTFLCSEPRQFANRTHLLFQRCAPGMSPDAYLVTLKAAEHGAIQFTKPGWKSAGVRPISISLRGQRYEAMLLFGVQDWVESDLGRWRVDQVRRRIFLGSAEDDGAIR